MPLKDKVEKLWTIDDLAEYLQVKPSVIKYWIYNSDIPFIKLGKYYRFDPEGIREWLAQVKSGINSAENAFKKIT